MSYNTLAKIAQSDSLMQRVKGALFSLTAAAPNIDFAARRISQMPAIMWWLAATPTWQTAWDAAVAAHTDDPKYDPGADGAVISDAAISAAATTLNSKL